MLKTFSVKIKIYFLKYVVDSACAFSGNCSLNLNNKKGFCDDKIY